MVLKKVLRKMEENVLTVKTSTIALVMALAGHAMGMDDQGEKENVLTPQDVKSEEGKKIPHFLFGDFEVTPDVFTSVEAEGLYRTNGPNLMRVDVMAVPTVSVHNKKSGTEAGVVTKFLLTNDMADSKTNSEYDIFYSEMYAYLKQQLGDGKMTFKIGNVQQMLDGSSVFNGATSTIMNDWFIDNGGGKTCNTIQIGWEKENGDMISLGWSGISNSNAVFDFSGSSLKNGQAVLVGTKKFDHVSLKGMTTMDFEGSGKASLGAFYNNGSLMGGVDLVYQNDKGTESLLSLLTVRSDIAKDLDAFFQAGAIFTEGKPNEWRAITGIEYKDGLRIYVGSTKDAHSSKPGFIAGLGGVVRF
ncbi:MAG: hypothetical protein LBU87_02185 [Lactobacillales bacterium]|jgi:hypothetical protein|nr:hypothetical protein [Lactobacillales bacterium]